MSLNNSVMTSDKLITPSIESNKANLNLLNLRDKIISSITDNPDSTDPESLITAFALSLAMGDMRAIVDHISDQVARYRFTPVISDPIISPIFVDGEGWIYSGFYFDRGKAIYLNKNTTSNPPQARLVIDESHFLNNGKYFIEINIEQMTSGTLSITDAFGQLIKTTNIASKISLEYIVTDMKIQQLRFDINGVNPNETVIIDKIAVHYVKESIDDYLLFKAADIVSGGGGGFASYTYVDTKDGETLDASKVYANAIVANALSVINSHINNTGNPHRITPQVIGAALAEHTHTLNELGAAAENHTHTHDQCGAAAENHTHTPQSLGAVSVNVYDLDMTSMDNRLDTVDGRLDLLDQHRNDRTGNPHSITFMQIGAAPTVHSHTGEDITTASTSNLGVISIGDGLSIDEDTGIVSVVHAPKLKNAITISLSGDVTGSTDIDGSISKNIKVTVNDNSHSHDNSTITSIDASKITSGTIDIARLPAAAIERLIRVQTDAERFALTTATVQNGDIVKVIETNLMFIIKDDTKLNNENGYESFTASAASSVHWSGVLDKPTEYHPEQHTHSPSEVGLSTIPNAKSNAINLDDSNTLATSKAVKTVNDKTDNALSVANGKANASHMHTSAEITGLGTAATKNITVSPSAPVNGTGQPGDIWFQYI